MIRVRRWTLGMLIMLGVLLFPAFALSQPECLPYDASLMPFYQMLTDRQQALFDRVYDALWDGEAVITLPENTSYGDAELVLADIRRECAELCLPREGFSIVWRRNDPDTAEEIRFSGDAAVMREARGQMASAIRPLLAELPEDSSEAASVIADRLCEILTYDASLTGDDYTAQAALATGKAMCATYSSLYALLCRMAGIPCAVIEGTVSGGRHAWNVLLIDGGYVLYDLTARDSGVSLPGSSYIPDDIFSELTNHEE